VRRSEKIRENQLIDKYLLEFDLVKCKKVTKMSEFKGKEEAMWRQALPIIYNEPNVFEDVEDLFDPGEDFEYPPEEDIYINVWKWENNTLIDMYAFPGENEGGVIFMNDNVILIVNDGYLETTKFTPKELKYKLSVFQHVRYQECIEDKYGNPNPNPHQHCVNINNRLC